MAIEFHCPYCTATVRVGLDAAGKVGRCPMCDTRLRVPTLDQITGKDRSRPAPVERHEPDSPTPFLHIPDVSSPPGPISPGSFAPAPAPPGPTPPGPFIPSPVPTGPFVPEPPSETAVHNPPLPDFPLINAADNVGATTKYLRSKKREPTYAPLIPPLIFLGAFVVIGLIYWQWSQPRFYGTLDGERLNPNQFIQTNIRAERFTIPNATFKSLVDEFRERPSELRSNLVNLRLTGGPEGITINLRPGSEADLVRVPLLEMPAIAKYYRDRYNTWDDLRQAEMQSALEKMIQNWLPLDDSGKRVSLPEYRETVAYNAFVRGLGRVCEAVVYSGGQPVKYPCVHEDADGQLYFLVPSRTREFTILQRSGLKQAKGFPSSFKVQVNIVDSPGPTFDVDRGPAKGEVTTPVEVIPFGTDTSPSAPAEPAPNAVMPGPPTPDN